MRRLFLLPLLILLMTGAAPRTAPARMTLAADSESRWVPFQLTPGNQIRFTVTLDGTDVSAVLDTGVSYSVVSRRYVAANRRSTVPLGRASAIGGAVSLGWVATRSLSFGGLSRSGGGLTVAEIPALAVGDAKSVDLLVGRDLVAGYALDIDYDNFRFRLLPSGRLPFAGASAPLSISADRDVYVTTLTFGRAQMRPVIVDTGDGSAITLAARSWAAADLKPRPKLTSTISYGIGGAIVSGLAVLPEVAIGALVAHDVEVRIEDAGGFSDSVGMAGRIGTSFLQHYRVLLDPMAGRMVLAPGATAGIPPERSTSGLLMGFSEGELVVLHVMSGSPAAAAGWQAGDRICSIDGNAIPRDYSTSSLARWSIGPPGHTVALGMCGGGTRRLTLRSFY